MPFLSPLRYPGGKRKLASFLKIIVHDNDLLDGDYVEPFAGGAGIALALLYGEYVRHIYINDLDRSVYAFWHSVINETEALCRLICDVQVTIDEWHRQRQIQADPNASLLELGFSTFFLNRTNRSGIISGGVIGGKAQAGKWKLDERYNKANLIKRIEKVARYRGRIHLHGLDASDFISQILPELSKRTLVYLDPPYFIKGRQQLYTNFYEPDDHRTVAQLVHSIEQHWMVSYDDVPEIRELYKDFKSLSYSLSYSAQARYRGAERMFFCHDLSIPVVTDPAKIKRRELDSFVVPS